MIEVTITRAAGKFDIQLYDNEKDILCVTETMDLNLLRLSEITKNKLTTEIENAIRSLVNELIEQQKKFI